MVVKKTPVMVVQIETKDGHEHGVTEAPSDTEETFNAQKTELGDIENGGDNDVDDIYKRPRKSMKLPW